MKRLLGDFWTPAVGSTTVDEHGAGRCLGGLLRARLATNA